MTLYLDTSSLVQLYVSEPGTDAAPFSSFDDALNRAARSLGRPMIRGR